MGFLRVLARKVPQQPFRWLLSATAVLLIGLAFPSTTTARAAALTYDAPALARVGAHTTASAEPGQSLPGDVQGWSASRSVEPEGTCTTPRLRSVATEAVSGAADSLTRVGRWMSPEEHAAMVRTGEVQVGAGVPRTLRTPQT